MKSFKNIRLKAFTCLLTCEDRNNYKRRARIAKNVIREADIKTVPLDFFTIFFCSLSFKKFQDELFRDGIHVCSRFNKNLTVCHEAFLEHSFYQTLWCRTMLTGLGQYFFSFVLKDLDLSNTELHLSLMWIQNIFREKSCMLKNVIFHEAIWLQYLFHRYRFPGIYEMT